jgi:hypothetical protein
VVVTVARLANTADAEEVARILAAGFAHDPVLTWVFREPDRAAKLSCFFDFLAREALVPLGATYLLPGSCAAWTPPDPPPWPAERNERFSNALSAACTTGDSSVSTPSTQLPRPTTPKPGCGTSA